MKMSRSIKDYKDAMDSVKISDSFYKRTEVLLNESSQMEIVKSSTSRIKLVTRSAMAIAACLLVAFGVKTVIDNRTEADSAVVTEIYQETTVVTVPVTIPETASPVIDRPEEGGFLNDSGVLIDDMPAIPEAETEDAAEETVSANTSAAPSDNKVTTDLDDDIPVVEEEAAPKAPTETMVTTTAREGYPAMAEPLGAENIPPLNEMEEYSDVEITPYFDMGTIRSGENPVSGSGSEFGELLSVISAVAAVSPSAENEAFKSLFLVKLSEKNSGITYYSIYVTDVSTLVVTRHDADNQKRVTYQLSAADYDKILLLLYTNFGNANEFDYFRNTEIGK